MIRFIHIFMILLAVSMISSCSGDFLDDVQILKKYGGIVYLKNQTPPDGTEIVAELLNDDAATKALFQSNDQLEVYNENRLDEINYNNCSLLAIYNYSTVPEWSITELSLNSKVLTVTYKKPEFYYNMPSPSTCYIYKIAPSMKGCTVNLIIKDK